MADSPRVDARRTRWRPVLRAFHRDVGYVCVGLTIVYALSGLAVNHIGDWDPSYRSFEHVTVLERPLADDDAAAAAEILAQLGIREAPRDVFRFESELQIELEQADIVADGDAGTIVHRGRHSRPFLRLANWLHLQRGKKAWNYVADSYAILLLFLALSGMFMLPGRRGIAGRGALFVGIGLAAPALYVILSGGPGGDQDPDPSPSPSPNPDPDPDPDPDPGGD